MGRRRSHASRRITVGLALLAAWILLLAAGGDRAGAAEAGQVRFKRIADSPFDRFLTDSTPEQQAFMREHYARMRGYPPFFTSHALAWAPPTRMYRDLYAIYNRPGEDGRDLLRDHPDWVLRDAAGQPLYIPYGCSGGGCPQYAADVGNHDFRRWWIGEVGRALGSGYVGIDVDDVNMEMRVGDAAGGFVRPIDTRTGAPMTDADWRRYVAEFTEEIRAAFPAAEIEHNAIWWAAQDDPYVQREVAAADAIQMERGFDDRGIVGGSGRWGYETYLSHVDWLHSMGAAVVFEPKELDRTSRVFELASYLLVNQGEDLISAHQWADPDNWWAGWSTDLGRAKAARYRWQGLWRRDFDRGMVLVNEPDAAARAVALPSAYVWSTLEGRAVKRVSLRAREAIVLRRGLATITLTGKRRVRVGRLLRLRGHAPQHAALVLQMRRGGRWTTLRRSRTRADGRFRARLRVRRAGMLRLRAVAAVAKRSRVLHVRSIPG